MSTTRRDVLASQNHKKMRRKSRPTYALRDVGAVNA